MEEKIVNTLKIIEEKINQEIIMDEETVKRYYLEDSVQEKQDCIENLSSAKQAIESLSKDKEQIEAELAEEKSEGQKASLQRDLEKVNAELSEKQTMLSENETRIQQIEKEMKETVKGTLEADKEMLEDLNKDRMLEQDNISRAKRAIESLSKDKESIEAEIAGEKNENISLSLQSDLKKINAELSEKQAMLSENETKLEETENRINFIMNRYEKELEKLERRDDQEKDGQENPEGRDDQEKDGQENPGGRDDQEKDGQENPEGRDGQGRKIEPIDEPIRKALEGYSIKVSAKHDAIYVDGYKIKNVGIASSLYLKKNLFKELDIDKKIMGVLGKNSILKRMFILPKVRAKLDTTILRLYSEKLDEEVRLDLANLKKNMSIEDYITSVYTKEPLPIDLSYELANSMLEAETEKTMQKIAREANEITGVKVEGLKEKQPTFLRKIMNRINSVKMIEEAPAKKEKRDASKEFRAQYTYDEKEDAARRIFSMHEDLRGEVEFDEKSFREDISNGNFSQEDIARGFELIDRYHQESQKGQASIEHDNGQER